MNSQSGTKKQFVKPEWAVNVAEGIERFRRQHGLATKSRIQEVLDIGKIPWQAISSGNSIVSDNSLYAGLFALGIVEADPTMVPARKVVTPRGVETETRRAWQREPDELGAWLSANKSKIIKKAQDAGILPTEETPQEPPLVELIKPAHQTPASTSSGVPSNVPQILLAINEAVVAMIGQSAASQTANQLAPQITSGFEQVTTQLQAINETLQRLQQPQIQPAVQNRQPWNVSELAERLREALLHSIQSTNSEGRDALMKQNKTALSALYMLLDPLTRTSEEREEGLRLQKVVK